MEFALQNIRRTTGTAMTIIIGLFLFVCNISAYDAENETRYYILLLLYSCIVFLHFASEIMREESALRKPALVCLFAFYFVFCLVAFSWPALLLLPFLVCYHRVINKSGIFACFLTGSVSMALLLCFFLVAPDGLRLIDFLLHSVIVILNTALCFSLFSWLMSYEKRLENLEKSMSISAVNELNEKIFSHELALQNDAAVQNARLAERETISRNMHNAVGHTITSSIMTLEAAYVLRDVSPDESMKKVLSARDKISQGLESIRQIVRMLDPENETTALTDLVSSMRICAEQFISSTSIGLVHNLKIQPMEMSIPKRHGEFITGALMELLSNASRADGVSTITVFLSYNRDYLRLTVSDNGCSFCTLSDEQKKNKLDSGYGLKKIEKYVRKSGGDCQIKTSDSFTVDLTIPITGDDKYDR